MYVTLHLACDITRRTYPTSQLFLSKETPITARFELGSKLAEGRRSNNVVTSDLKFSYSAPLATVLNTVFF
jgi:hypothetical protein